MNITYYEAKDSPVFPPVLIMLVRFVRPQEAIKCVVCGKRRKRLWTMLVPFRGQTIHQYMMTSSDKLEALTPICEDHPMIPVFIELMEKTVNQ